MIGTVEDNEEGDPTTDVEEEPPADSDPYTVSLSVDAILSLLSHHRRRNLLAYLVDEADRMATIEECVSHIAEREEARTGDRPGHDHVETDLHHTHIPKLEDAGIVEYDTRNKEFRYRGHEDLEAWLDRIRAHEPGTDT